MQSPLAQNDRLAPCAPAILPLDVATDHRRPTVGIAYIARRLGRENSRVPSLVTRIRQLIRGYGFPPPSNPRLYMGQVLVGAQAVDLRARWDQGLVDAWFDDRFPPELTLAIDNEETERAASVLDARAARIGRRA
jgi:hypothetical protein